MLHSGWCRSLGVGLGVAVPLSKLGFLCGLCFQTALNPKPRSQTLSPIFGYSSRDANLDHMVREVSTIRAQGLGFGQLRTTTLR